jgi:hypothetical protein
MIWERPADAVEDAVDGRWLLYAAIWASERAVRVRPGTAVSPQHYNPWIVRLLTSTVRRMLLHLPT